jgi:hypothetical protein
VGDSTGPLAIVWVRRLACFGRNHEFCSAIHIHETLLRYFTVPNLPNRGIGRENKVFMV